MQIYEINGTNDTVGQFFLIPRIIIQHINLHGQSYCMRTVLDTRPQVSLSDQ